MGAWDEVQYVFGDRIRAALSGVPASMKERAQEIRLRLGQPVALTVDARSWFWDGTGLRVDQHDLDDALRRLCEGALYSREEQVRQGYVPLRQGHRAGLCGSFQPDNSHLYRLSSINVRLAHGVLGCADVLRACLGNEPVNLLLIGPPGSGKTTLLRDLVRRWSLAGYRVGIADEREELAGGGCFDLGPCVDVIASMNKAHALRCLLRYMNPQVRVFDELGDHGSAVDDCLTAGVRVATTLHADSLAQAKQRLTALGVAVEHFDVMVVLGGQGRGQIREWEWLHDLANGRHSSDCLGAACGRVS